MPQILSERNHLFVGSGIRRIFLSNCYNRLVLIVRVSFFAIIALLVFLQCRMLYDYVVVIAFVVLIIGLFPMSDVMLFKREALFTKHYFWALYRKHYRISFTEIISIKRKLDVDSNPGRDLFYDGFIFDIIAHSSRKAKLQVVKIVYQVDGASEDLEVKLNKKDLERIEYEVNIRKT